MIGQRCGLTLLPRVTIGRRLLIAQAKVKDKENDFYFAELPSIPRNQPVGRESVKGISSHSTNVNPIGVLFLAIVLRSTVAGFSIDA